MKMITETTELRSEAAIYAEGTGYTTDDLVRAYNEYAAKTGEDSDDCQRFFERFLAESSQIKVVGHSIQYDKSGVGHAWVDATEIDCLPSIQEEIAGEIIDGKVSECEDYVASNGCHYRW